MKGFIFFSECIQVAIEKVGKNGVEVGFCNKESLIIAHIQTEIRKQIGVKYPADDEDY